MKLKSKWNFVVDALMFIFLIPVFIGRGHLHQILGCAAGALFITHILLHLNQIDGLFCAWFKKKSSRRNAVVIFCVFTIAITFVSIKMASVYEMKQKQLLEKPSIESIQVTEKNSP